MRAVLLGPSLQGSDARLDELFRSVRLESSDIRIGVDAGTAEWLKRGIKPDFAVGDWDSLKASVKNSKAMLSSIPHVTLSKDKDRSDLFYSVVAAMEAGATEILCLGVTGGRPDHHMAACLDLALFSTGKHGNLNSVSAWGVEAEYCFLSERIPVWRTSQMGAKREKGTVVSLFALGAGGAGVSTPCQVTLTGFKYPIRKAGRSHTIELMPSSRGLSNALAKKTSEVHLRNGQLLVIIPSMDGIK